MGGDYVAGYRLGIPKPKPIKRLRPWLYLILVGLSLLFLFLCRLPVMRLASTPPAGFFDDSPNWSPQRREAEHRLALAYWERVVTVVQRNYFYGVALPEHPPPEFEVDLAQVLGAEKAPPNSRERYWRKLCTVWGLPQNWRQTQEWNTEWLTRTLRLLFRKLQPASAHL